MKNKKVLYYCSLLVMIWFKYFIVISFILMLVYHKDWKNRIIQSVLLALIFYLLSRGIDVSSKLFTTLFATALMFCYEPFKQWRDNRTTLK